MSDELINKVHELLEADDLGRCKLTDWERDRLERWAAEIELGRDVFSTGQTIKIREIYEERIG